jgi:hypothetical protein
MMKSGVACLSQKTVEPQMGQNRKSTELPLSDERT